MPRAVRAGRNQRLLESCPPFSTAALRSGARRPCSTVVVVKKKKGEDWGAGAVWGWSVTGQLPLPLPACRCRCKKRRWAGKG